jgi:hypothetical protein
VKHDFSVEQTAMKTLLAIAVFCLPAFGQATYSGQGLYAGPGIYGGVAGGPQTFYAALPLYWVDNTVCNPPGGVYDTTIILGTTTNIGPNNAGESVGLPYASTYQGLLDAMDNWRDNADNASQTPHFADRWWLIQVPAGTVLHGSTFDANDALISLPGKLNAGSEPSKCLVIDSTTPLPTGQMACGRGLPGFGGTRNPGCASPADKTSMWKVQLDSMGTPAAAGRVALYAGADLATPTNWVSHVVVRNIEVTEAPGSAQSAAGVHAARLIRVTSFAPNPSFPTTIQTVTHLGLDRYYVHAWDPGDAGQPSGACAGWTNTSGTGGAGVSVAPDSGNPGTSLVTIPSSGYSSSGNYFGMTFTVGSTITLNSTNYTIANTSYTQGVLTGTQNTQISITGSVTLTSPTFTQSNPPSQYANGCGDDVEKGIDFNCDYCWLQNGYVEKIHWSGNDSQGVAYGFSNGPYKIVNNWFEGGSESLFSGGGPVDTNGGPPVGLEIRRNYIGKDLNWRQLTGSSGNSPAPPWGCGTADSSAGHNTCPESWAIKNDLEFKLGEASLVAGNVIENSWADGQQGFCVLINARTCSGGSACGIYNSITGLPRTGIDNIRFESNWVRNCPEPFQMSNRSGAPGDGGGLSLPVQDNDFINNLFTNIGDTNQFNNPGHEWEWTSGQNPFHCSMSYSGSGPYIVTATCLPYQSDITGHITAITSVSNVVTIADANRIDPILCTSGDTVTCIANGQTVILSNHSGWNGTFAMTGTTGNWSSDGTGGNNLSYTDTINSPGTATLCNNSGSPTCTSLLASGDVTVASLGYKMTDISVGDDVYASNVGSGDTTCSTNGYAVGATSATYATAGTITTGLTVVYQVSTQPTATSANCIINNGAGFPKYTTFQNNTVLSPNVVDIEAVNQWWQPISNDFYSNVYADNDAGKGSDLDCNAISSGEGTPSFACWDSNTFEFYSNVLATRNPANWSVVNCPGGTCVNYFPTTVNCANSTADPTCLGYAGFMGSNPALTYPTGACAYDGSNPFNCPLMALPWANNFTYTDVYYVGNSSYSAQGVNTTTLNNVMTETEYVCPSGGNCGTHGPYPD